MRKRLLVVGLICIPLAAWIFIKPLRVIFPRLAGLSCVNETLCMDDVSRFQEAAALYDSALSFVGSSVGSFEKKPRVIFCGSEDAYKTFGLGKRSSATIGTLGIVIGPHAWKPYLVRHEMIHYLQYERLGTIQAWRSPKWFMEGMAYSLSEDPRTELAEPFEQYRSRFEEWYRRVGKKWLWVEAGNL